MLSREMQIVEGVGVVEGVAEGVCALEQHDVRIVLLLHAEASGSWQFAAWQLLYCAHSHSH